MSSTATIVKRRIVILGGGGHSRVVMDLLERMNFDIVGYTAPESSGDKITAPYLGSDQYFSDAEEDGVISAAVGIGKTDASASRIDLVRKLMGLSVAFPVILSPSSVVHKSVELAEATVVMDGAVVVSGAVLGKACIVNTSATIDHDCKLGDDVHIAPGAVLCGGVRVGTSTLIGAGAVVAPSVAIAEGCVIGAGSTVTENIDVPGTYVGSPARRIS